MIYEALERIQYLANERFNLYRLAGSHHLTAQQVQRIHDIENELSVQWDQHRREVASEHWRYAKHISAIRERVREVA